MTNQTEIQKIETDIENFLLRIEKKMPLAVKAACVDALKYITPMITLLNNNSLVIDFTKLVPEAEVAREAIIAILTQLQKDFQAISDANQQAVIKSAGGQIAAAIHGVGAAPSAYMEPYSIVSKNSD